MKTLLILAFSAILAVVPQHFSAGPTPDDYKIVSDKTEAGIRSIVATPAPLVCCSKISIKVDVKTTKIESLVITGGCPGNGKAVSSLLKGLTVQQALQKIDGIMCGNKGTSCTDQIARILKKSFPKNSGR